MTIGTDELERLREAFRQAMQYAYEEGVEDGVEWQQSRRSDRGEPQPQWIDSVARVTALQIDATLTRTRTASSGEGV